MNDLAWPSKLSTTLYKEHDQTPEEVMATVNVNPAHAFMSRMIEDFFYNMSKVMGVAHKMLAEKNGKVLPQEVV